MDLASLSLGQIASMLSPKQQEVLLASISVAANLIQQIQHEEQEREIMMQQLNYSNDHLAQLNANGQVVGATVNQAADNAHLNHRRHLDHDDDDEDDDEDEDEFDDDDDDYDTDNNLTDLTLDSNASNIINTNNRSNLSHQQHHHQFHHSDKKPRRPQQQQTVHHTHQTNDTQNTTQSNRNNSSINNNASNNNTDETDATDLATIRLFAEELKQRRKSIRLSQKGAAQSLRAFTGGAQPCTDAIIYHFENLQLEPERAMQLIPLLRDWLDWAEKHRLNGKQLPMMSAITKVPRERKRKVVLFNEKAKHYLEDAFAKNNHPDRYQLDVISEELNIPTRSIRKWFTNRRQRKRFAEKFLSAGNTSSTSI